LTPILRLFMKTNAYAFLFSSFHNGYIASICTNALGIFWSPSPYIYLYFRLSHSVGINTVRLFS